MYGAKRELVARDADDTGDDSDESNDGYDGDKWETSADLKEQKSWDDQWIRRKLSIIICTLSDSLQAFSRRAYMQAAYIYLKTFEFSLYT